MAFDTTIQLCFICRINTVKRSDIPTCLNIECQVHYQEIHHINRTFQKHCSVCGNPHSGSYAKCNQCKSARYRKQV